MILSGINARPGHAARLVSSAESCTGKPDIYCLKRTHADLSIGSERVLREL